MYYIVRTFPSVCDNTQNVKQYRYFFLVPNFLIQIPVFFTYQIFPISVPRLFSGTKIFRYWFRDFFPVPNFSDTGSDTTKKMKNSRYREFPVPVRHTLLWREDSSSDPVQPSSTSFLPASSHQFKFSSFCPSTSLRSAGSQPPQPADDI